MSKHLKKLLPLMLALLIIASALIGCGGKTVGKQLDKVKANGKLIIGIEGTYPPFTYHDDNGALTGLDVELGRKIAEKLGVEAEFVEAAWDSLLIGMDTGRFDLVINAVSITEKRQEKYTFSTPYYYEGRRVIVRADDNSINSEEDLNGKKVATNTTNAFIPWYEEKGCEIVSIDTSSEALGLVLSGRADFCNTSMPVFNSYLEAHPEAQDQLKVSFIIPNSEDIIAIPTCKGEDAFLAEINKILDELRADGTLAALSEQFLKGDYTTSAFAN